MSLELTPGDMADKIRASHSVGVPVFLTQGELRWLAELLLNFADEFKSNNSSMVDKLDYLKAVSIGVKCALELERNSRD